MQVVDQSDLSWWQAQVVGSEDRKVGLIPSQELEERRKAFVPQEYDYVHKTGICGTRVRRIYGGCSLSTSKNDSKFTVAVQEKH